MESEKKTTRMIATAITVLLCGCNLPEKNSEVKDIEQLFLNSYKITTDGLVYTAPNNQEICAIKPNSANPLPVVINFLDMLVSISSFNYRISKVAKIEDCSLNTTFYLNIDQYETSQKNEEHNHQVLIDRTKIIRQLPPIKVEGPRGYFYYGLISKRTNLYASIAEYEDLDFPLVDKLRQKNMQEEIYQVLIAGFDVEQEEVPFSILQEMSPKQKEHGKAMTEWLDTNPINVCKVDLIMFQLRYPADHIYPDKVTLKDYFQYLGDNFEQLAAKADETVANPAYEDIFVRPC